MQNQIEGRQEEGCGKDSHVLESRGIKAYVRNKSDVTRKSTEKYNFPRSFSNNPWYAYFSLPVTEEEYYYS